MKRVCVICTWGTDDVNALNSLKITNWNPIISPPWYSKDYVLQNVTIKLLFFLYFVSYSLSIHIYMEWYIRLIEYYASGSDKWTHISFVPHNVWPKKISIWQVRYGPLRQNMFLAVSLEGDTVFVFDVVFVVVVVVVVVVRRSVETLHCRYAPGICPGHSISALFCWGFLSRKSVISM